MKKQLCALFSVALGVVPALPALSSDFAPEAAIAPATESFEVAQQTGDIPVSERPSYVNTCRSSGASVLNVTLDSRQTRPLRQIQPYTRIVLSGVLAPGVAQIREPVAGWVPSATLLTNCDAGPVTSNPGQCYQVLADALQVRTAPYGDYRATVVRGTRVYAGNPPQRQTTSDGRRWLYVYDAPSTALGWLSESGSGGVGSNLGACS
ncbi:hypothetical protein ACQ4M4_17815 [Leptolyngbya sp. AN02str]|uniref:hypothetical protein n=1 Tax=Leptolyngbya sp. AN02str TaxID=3423363 RepID=UPI003D3244D1